MRAFCLALPILFCPLLFPVRTSGDVTNVLDIDVGVPPGTPLDWFLDTREPVPTGGRGDVPTGDEKAVREAKRAAEEAQKGGVPPGAKQPGQGGPGDPDRKPVPDGMTVVEKRVQLPPATHNIPNLYDYFGITTMDFMNHVAGPAGIQGALKFIEGTESARDDVATGTRDTAPRRRGPGKFLVEVHYPPTTPMELGWMIIIIGLRASIHSEIVSGLEANAYLLRLGFPGQSLGGSIKAPPFPAELPQIPKGKSSRDNMLHRLAVADLISGYPYGFDPNFAARTLALGDEMYDSLVLCSRSKHTFLAENAVAVLANSSNPKAVEELRKNLKSADPVIVIRSMIGLARHRDEKAVPDLIGIAKGGSPVFQAYALHCLGVIGDRKGAEVCLECALQFERNPDLAWSAIPSLGRLANGSDKTVTTLKNVERALWAKCGGDDHVVTTQSQGPTGIVTSEPPGSKFRILRQMAMMALAANGEKSYRDEFLRRMNSPGYTDFHKSVWYILIDCLMHCGGDGTEHVKRLVDGGGTEQMKAHGLRHLASARKVDSAYLKSKATGGAPMVRSLALQLLAVLDPAAGSEAAVQIVRTYGSGGGKCMGGEAHVVATAANVGGALDADWGDSILRAAQRAYSAEDYARRVCNDNPDIRQFSLEVFPPLLESLMVEVGRPQMEEAVPFLVEVLKSQTPTARAEAALALGNIGGAEAVKALLEALEDGDGWVRFGAYRALKRITGEDYFCDWIFFTDKSRAPYVEAYKEWVKAHPAE